MTAKRMQAQFLCLAHNLMVLKEAEMDERLEEANNPSETNRCDKRNQQAREQCIKAGREHSPLLYNQPRKRSQLTLKFIRWLRHNLRLKSLIKDAIQSLRHVYAMLWNC